MIAITQNSSIESMYLIFKRQNRFDPALSFFLFFINMADGFDYLCSASLFARLVFGDIGIIDNSNRIMKRDLFL